MNRFGDAEDFIRRWERGDEAGVQIGSSIPIKPGSYSAAVLTPSHPDFFARIEPGIRNLVKLLVSDLGWITYSSCEGHPTQEGRTLMPRHVGVLPRSRTELLQQRAVLYGVAAAANVAIAAGASVAIREVMLECRDDKCRPVLDILFVPLDAEAAYFEFLDHLTDLVTSGLRRLIHVKNESAYKSGASPNSSRADDCFVR